MKEPRSARQGQTLAAGLHLGIWRQGDQTPPVLDENSPNASELMGVSNSSGQQLSESLDSALVFSPLHQSLSSPDCETDSSMEEGGDSECTSIHALMDNEMSRMLSRRSLSRANIMNHEGSSCNSSENCWGENSWEYLTGGNGVSFEAKSARENLHMMVSALFERHDIVLEQKHQALSVIFNKLFDFDFEVEADITSLRSSFQGAFISSVLKKLGLYSLYKSIRWSARHLSDHMAFTAFCFIVTLYILFVPDMVSAFGPKDLDSVCLIANTIVWFICLFEMCVYTVSEHTYLCSATFLLDFIAILSFLSDTWLYQGNLFLNDDGTKVTRYARSARVARMIRLAKVAKWTRLTPKMIQIFGGQNHGLAKACMTRRLRRLFNFLDSDSAGFVTNVDLKCFYVTVLQESHNLEGLLFGDVGRRARLDMIRKDVGTIKEAEYVKQMGGVIRASSHSSLSSVLHRSASQVDRKHKANGIYNLDFDEFSKLIFNTEVGKALLQQHVQEASQSDGGWTLTQEFSARASLKVCVGVLIVVIVFNFLQPQSTEGSAEVGLALLATSSTSNTSLADLCHQVARYSSYFAVLLVFLNDVTYLDVGSGVECLSGGIPRSEVDPFQRIEELTEDHNLRYEHVYLACSPGSAVDGKSDFECDEWFASSGAMIVIEDAVRQGNVYDLYETFAVIACLLLWTTLFSHSITMFCRTLLEPLRALVDDMKAMSILELVYIDAEDQVPRSRKLADEMLNIQSAFRMMQRSIRFWAKMVPPTVVQRLFSAGIEASIGVSKCECSILFCDIEGFEEGVRGTSPQEVLKIMHSVFDRIGEVVDRDGGTLLEFIGDEILAVYNAPCVLPNHVLHAALSAVDINVAMKKEQLQIGGVSVRCRCGVHTASVLAGNVGSPQRMKYGLLGDGVNLAARLKGLNSKYNTLVLATDEVVSDSLTRRRVLHRPIDRVVVKGREEPTTVFELLCRASRRDAAAKRVVAEKHTEAFRLYQNRQFREAKELFVEVRAAVLDGDAVEDEPSRQLASRCVAHLRHPPPLDWDGVQHLNAKTFIVDDLEEDLCGTPNVATSSPPEGDLSREHCDDVELPREVSFPGSRAIDLVRERCDTVTTEEGGQGFDL